MVVKYEWISGGGTFKLPAPLTPHSFVLTPIHGTGLKRVQFHASSIQGKNAGLDAAVVEPIVISTEVYVNTGVGGDPSKLRFSQSSQLPMWNSGFFADAVDVYNVWWSGGSREFGFNEEIQAGKPSDPEGPTIVIWLFAETPGGTYNYADLIDCNIAVRALYSYLG